MPHDDAPAHSEEQVLRAEIERLRGLVDLFDAGSADLVIRVAPDGRIRFASRASRTLLGLAPTDLIGTSLQERVHPEDRTRVLGTLRGATEGAPFRVRYRLRRGDDTYVRVETTGTTCVDPLTGLYSEIATTTREYLYKQLAAERIQHGERGGIEAMVANLNDGIIRCDTGGYFLYANARACRALLGRDEGLVGRHYLEFVREDHRKTLAQHLIDQKRHRIPSTYVEYPVITPDGREMWVGMNAHLEEENGEIVAFSGVVRDVSERKMMESALRRSEAELRALVEAISDVVFVLDRDGRYLKVVSGRPGLLVRPPSELVGRTMHELVPAATADRFLGWVQEALERRTHVDAEYALQVDERVKWFECTISPIDDARVVWVARDITARKATEAALRKSEQRYRSVADSLREVLFQLDGDLRCVFLSAAWRDLTGRSIEESLGIRFTAFLADEDRPACAERLTAMLGGQAGGFAGEVRCVTTSGAIRWLEVRASVVRDDTSGADAIRGTLHDITERKHLESQLQHAQKMEAVGRLAGGVAHDFNNLLTAISTNAQIALAEVGEGQSLREELEQIHQAARRAGELTRQLLAFSRKQRLDPRTIQLNEVVEEAGRLLGRVIGEDIHLVTDLNPSLDPVVADPGQVTQVIMNLGVNARDAMPEGGILTITTSNVVVEPAQAARLPGMRAGAYVLLVMRDSGVGMSRETQQHLFEPFFTTKEPGKGTGLGLSTVYGIVKQSGGFVYVSSTPGRGSVFSIYFPRSGDAPARAVPDRPAETRALPSGRETVLVVEDEPQVRSAACRVLRKHGYTVLEAQHGADALQIWESAGADIDLVVTDVVMPGLGGRELVDHLRSRGVTVPVLFISGYTAGKIPGGGNDAGDPRVAFLPKPFTIDALLLRVREMLDLKRDALSP